MNVPDEPDEVSATDASMMMTLKRSNSMPNADNELARVDCFGSAPPHEPHHRYGRKHASPLFDNGSPSAGGGSDSPGDVDSDNQEHVSAELRSSLHAV
jgi:hypothetical protein